MEGFVPGYMDVFTPVPKPSSGGRSADGDVEEERIGRSDSAYEARLRWALAMTQGRRTDRGKRKMRPPFTAVLLLRAQQV